MPVAKLRQSISVISPQIPRCAAGQQVGLTDSCGDSVQKRAKSTLLLEEVASAKPVGKVCTIQWWPVLCSLLCQEGKHVQKTNRCKVQLCGKFQTVQQVAVDEVRWEEGNLEEPHITVHVLGEMVGWGMCMYVCLYVSLYVCMYVW